MTEEEARRLEVLRWTYPAWSVRHAVWQGRDYGWWATRRSLTPAERAAGVCPSIARRTLADLVGEIDRQEGLAHLYGAWRPGGGWSVPPQAPRS